MDLSKMESWHSPLTVTLLTGAATSQMEQQPRAHFSSLIVGLLGVASVLPESSMFTCNICEKTEMGRNDLEQHAVVFRASIIWPIWSPWLILHRLGNCWQQLLLAWLTGTVLLIFFMCFCFTHLICVPVLPNSFHLTVVVSNKYLSKDSHTHRSSCFQIQFKFIFYCPAIVMRFY